MIYEHTTICPRCGGPLRYFNKVKRIVRSKNGKIYRIDIRRMICCDCGSIHRELPSYLLPYKHYQSYIIHGFMSGNLNSFDLDFEDYPSETTIKRWKKERTL